MHNIIVTAFEPFNGRDTNTSLEVLKNLNSKNILKRTLPVSWSRSLEEVKNLLDFGPDLLVLCGEALGRKKVTIEKLAINYMDAPIADNDGIIKKNQRMFSGLDGYFSNVDVKEIVDGVNKDDDLVQMSLSAGSYICNATYYQALSKVYGNTYPTKVIFVHFPVAENDDDVKQNFPRTLEKIIEEIAKKYGFSGV